MRKFIISELSRSLIEIAWYFGPKGLNGDCCEDLTMPEFLALEKISRTTDCPVQDVGHHLGFTKSGATRVVNRLESKGYVQKVKSSGDGRVCCVELTENGKDILRITDSRYLENFQKLLGKMPQGALPAVKEIIQALGTALRDLKS